MRVTVVFPTRNTSPVASVNSNVPPLRCRQLAWPSPTKRSTRHITNALSAAALRRDGGAGRDLTSEPHRLSRRILAPAPMIEISIRNLPHGSRVNCKSRKTTPRLLLSNCAGLGFLVRERFLGALFFVFTPRLPFRLGSLRDGF